MHFLSRNVFNFNAQTHTPNWCLKAFICILSGMAWQKWDEMSD